MGDQSKINANDIENLEGKIDDLSEDIQSLDQTVKKVLLEGNGDKPLTVKAAQNRSKIDQNRTSIKRIYALMSSIPVIGSAIVGIIKAI